MSLLLTLLVSLSILSVATCDTATITVPPLPTTATLYTPVDFTCEGHGGDLAWTIDGNAITDTVKQERAITSITTNTSNGTISSVLTIISLPVNDGIYITCIIGTNIFDAAHSSAPLTIRGISPVENVSLYLNSSMLYWSPPSSIPSQYHPLLSYIVTITIGTNGPADVYTTNNTSLQLSYLAIILCDIVNATITVASGNYSSDGTVIIDEYADYNYTTISKPDISYNSNHDCFDVNFNITIVCIVLCKNTFIQGNSTPETPENYPKIPIDTNDTTASHTVKYGVSVITDTPQSYNFFVKVYNSIDKEIKLRSDSVNFTTYHVQNVSVHRVDNSAVRVECTFVYQSIADGCHIKLTTDGSIPQSFNISLRNESNIASQNLTLSVNGNYSVTAYDIVNGIITDTPSVQYDDIFPLMDSGTTSDITTTPTSTTTSDTPLPSTSQLLPSNIHPSNDTSTTDTATNTYIILVIAGSITGGVFIILLVISIIVIGSCIVITKRNNKKKRSVALNAERAIVRLPHSNNNQYSDIVLPSITIQSSSVVYTSNNDNPYHNTIDEFIPNGRRPHGDVSPYHNYPHEYITNGRVSAAGAVGSNGQLQHNESSSFPHDNNEGGASIPASAGTTIHGQPHYVNINDDRLTSSGLPMKQQELPMGQHILPPQRHMSSDSSISADSDNCLLPPYDDYSTDSSSIESTSSHDDINTTTVPVPVSIDDTCSQIICPPPNSQLPAEMINSMINFIDNNNADDASYVTEQHRNDSNSNTYEEFVGIHTNDKTPTPSDTNNHRNDVVVGVVFEDTPENCKAFGLSYEHVEARVDYTVEVLADDDDDIIEPVQVQGDDIDGNVIGWREMECYDERVFEKTSSMVNANPFKVLHTDNDNGWREDGCHEMVVGMTMGRKSFLETDETNGSNGVANNDQGMTDEVAKPHSNMLRRFIMYIERLKSAVCDSITFY